MTPQSSGDLSSRYGDPRPLRPLAISLGVLVSAAFLGWLAWATWFHATPKVASELETFRIVDAHSVSAEVLVSLEEDVDASCQLRALAEDHSVVGEGAFTPVDGRNEWTLRTERQAVTVELLGCTAEGQPRPQ